MRLMAKGILAIFLLMSVSISLSAQYVVQGVVTDSLTKEPLSYASVRLKEDQRKNLRDFHFMHIT